MENTQITGFESQLGLFEAILQLKRLPRTGWLLAGVTAPESIADHSYGTAMVAVILADLVNTDLSSTVLTAPLDSGLVARIALVHDLAESLVTDLPLQTAELLGREAKHTIEAKAIERLFVGHPIANDYLALWSEYEAGSTPEGRIVRDADKLEMVLQARQYASGGNQNLAEFWQGHTWYYEASRRIFQSLHEEFQALG